MLKKVISFILSAVMLCGLANVSVSADAPMYFDGITTNVFDQDFGDISSTSEASDFAFKGKWVCTGEFVTIADTSSGTIKTKNNIDLTGAYGYEFSVKMIMTQNNDDIYLAYNEADSKGYKVNISRKNSKISLYRAGNSTALKTSSVSIDYGAPHVWTARLEGDVLTISKSGTVVLEYPAADDENPDTEAASLNGIFGIEKGSDENFAVLNMKLDKLGQGVTVNDWRYDKTISAKDTKESLAAEGLTFTTSNSVTPTYSSSNGIYFGSNPGETNFYYNKELNGDYTVRISYYTNNANATRVIFNGSSYKNCFAILYDIKSTTKTYSIRKYASGTGTVLPVEPEESTEVASAVLSKSSTTVTHLLRFKDNGDDTITVTATAYRANSISSDYKTAEVSATIKKSDLYTPAYNKIRVYWGAPNKSKFYRFTAYSTPSGETKTRDVSVINKEFATGDTVTSLKNEGINLSTTPTSITDVTHWKSWKGYDGLYWDQYNSSGDKYKAYATIAEPVSGNYTFSATTKVYQNYADIIVNSKSTSTDYWTKGAECYYIQAKNTGLEIKKKNNAADDVTTLKTIKYKKADGTELTKLSDWSGYAVTTTVDVINNVDGSVTIKAKAVQLHTGYTAEDEVTDSASPYTSGYCRVAFSNGTGEFRNIYDMKLTKHETYVDEGEYEGKFYIDGEEAVCYEKGEIYFETPVVDLGTYTVVAALYEDNEMTGLKTFTPRDMCEGKIRLFNTSGSDAKESYVKVYLLDSIETLNKTMNVWTLR